MKIVLFSIVLWLAVLKGSESQLMSETTCDRITQHGYPCENHTVTTSDGYQLALFRIPFSPRGNKEQVQNKPAVLMMHCLMCSSDIWIINGPNDGLCFMLADEGYDVWLANARGNVYSMRHTTLQPSSEDFWAFSLDEIGQIDIPANIDYILNQTSQKSVHYIGYSQGTTVFMIFASSKPEYSSKIKSSHLLAPAVYLCYMQSPVGTISAQFLGRPNDLTNLFGTLPMYEIHALVRGVASAMCIQPQYESLCIDFMNFISGWGSPYLNRTLLPIALSIVPAGGSNRQINQFLQTHITCKFKAYDFGYRGNILKYGQPQPPAYNLKKIQFKTPIDIYFSDNDYFASLRDVRDLYKTLGEKASWHRVKYPKFNHLDFTVSQNVKYFINNCVVSKIQKYEGRNVTVGSCKSFRNKAF